MSISNYLPVWNKLSNEQQQKLLNASYSRNFKRGELIRRGGDCMGLILVCSGQLRAYTVSPDGREITLYRLFECDICLLSASCMMNSLQIDIVIETEKDTETIIIPADVYKSIMEESAPLGSYTNEVMASRFSDVVWLMEQIMWKSFDKRLAGFLLDESNIEGSFVLSITHETIGKHLGNPREVVTRMLKYFSTEGMVKLSRGTVELKDIKALQKLAEE